MPSRQLRRANSAVEVEAAFIAASTARRNEAGYAKPSCAINVRVGRNLPGAIRTTATSIPSAEVPLMMPATVMVLVLMRAAPPTPTGWTLPFRQSAESCRARLRIAVTKALWEPRGQKAWLGDGEPGRAPPPPPGG